MMKKRISLLLLMVSLAVGLQAQQLAFPGAEGFGKYALGGRGGAVVYVTNLNDAGPGSLRQAIASYKGQKRTIVFSVSGTIELQSTIEIKYDAYLTIAGQTAPGDGICVKNFPIKVGDSHDIILRYLRFRIGDEQDCGDGCDEIDALSFRKCYNIVVDHCSLGWSIDAVLDLTVTTGFSTVQWCLLHEPLNESKHSKGGHSYLAGWDGNSYGGGTTFGGGTYHHNLLVSGGSRTPRLDSYAGDNDKRDLIDISNNVIYNWSGYGAYGGENADVNWLNNYYKQGPSTTSRKNQIFLPGNTCKMYVDGNYVDGYPDVTADNSKGIYMESSALTKDQVLQDEPYDVWEIDLQSAQSAYKQVLSHAGAFVPNRDNCDARIINDVVNRTGKIIDSPSEVGGWPVLNGAEAPLDTDLDGMPDVWEDAHGLDKNNAADRNNITGSGYTQLEVYLNSIEFRNPVRNVRFEYTDNTGILVSWDDTYLAEDTFRIERSVQGADFAPIAYLPENTTSFTDTEMQSTNGVIYRVVAVQNGVIETKTSEIIAAESIDLQISDTIYVGDTVNIGIVIVPENATNRLVEWKIEKGQELVELSQAGILIAKEEGEVDVKAQLMDGSNLSANKKLVIKNLISSVFNYRVEGLENLIDVYPNPSRDGIFTVAIDPELTGKVDVAIRDMAGRMLFETSQVNRQSFTLNHRLQSGIYVLEFSIQRERVLKKIVVKNLAFFP